MQRDSWSDHFPRSGSYSMRSLSWKKISRPGGNSGSKTLNTPQTSASAASSGNSRNANCKYSVFFSICAFLKIYIFKKVTFFSKICNRQVHNRHWVILGLLLSINHHFALKDREIIRVEKILFFSIF